jgi:hypothetical protein
MLTVWEAPAAGGASRPDAVLGPDVVLVRLEDGSARLLDMAGGFYALSAVGARMLRGVLERGTAATVQDLALEYEVGPERVRSDLEGLLAELRRQRLLHTGPARRPGGAAPHLLLAPCLGLVRRLPRLRWRAAALLALAYLSLALLGWARTVAAWRHGAGGMAPHGDGTADRATAAAVDGAVRDLATSLPFPVACKERALACWALARWAGLPVALVVGLELFPLAGHCWCASGPWTLSDDAERCALFTPVLRYA